MKYIVEDTDNGYRIRIPGSSGHIGYTETGGHGPVEELYAHAERTWSTCRARYPGHVRWAAREE